MVAVETNHCSKGRVHAETRSSSSRSSQQARTWDVPAPVATWFCLDPAPPPESAWPFARGAGWLIEADSPQPRRRAHVPPLRPPRCGTLLAAPHTSLRLRPRCGTDLVLRRLRRINPRLAGESKRKRPGPAALSGDQLVRPGGTLVTLPSRPLSRSFATSMRRGNARGAWSTRGSSGHQLPLTHHPPLPPPRLALPASPFDLTSHAQPSSHPSHSHSHSHSPSLSHAAGDLALASPLTSRTVHGGRDLEDLAHLEGLEISKPRRPRRPRRPRGSRRSRRSCRSREQLSPTGRQRSTWN